MTTKTPNYWYIPILKTFPEKYAIKEWRIDAIGQEKHLFGFVLVIWKQKIDDYTIVIEHEHKSIRSINVASAPSRKLAIEYAKAFMNSFNTWRKFANFTKNQIGIDLMKI